MRDDVVRKRNEYRMRALARSAIRARKLSPEEGLEIGFDLIASARRLRDAGEASLV